MSFSKLWIVVFILLGIVVLPFLVSENENIANSFENSDSVTAHETTAFRGLSFAFLLIIGLGILAFLFKALSFDN